MKESKAPAPKASDLDLEFPDWSGMDDSTARVTPEAAFRLCEAYGQFWAKAQVYRRETSDKCTVEFVL